MARDPLTRDVVEIVRSFHRRPGRQRGRRSRALVRGRRRHRQDDARDVGLQAGDRVRAARSRSTRCRAFWRASAAPTTARPASSPIWASSPAHLGRPAPHRRPRGREALRLGARAALRDRRRALRHRALDVVTTNLDHERARAADRRADRLAPGQMCEPLPLYGDDRRYASPRAARAPVPSIITARYAGHRDHRDPVGRRGQGQGRRPARRARRDGRALPGRQQRRPHDRPRRRDVQVPPDPVRDPAPGQDLRDRQRRGRRPRGADRRDRRPAPARHRRQRAASSRPTPT